MIKLMAIGLAIFVILAVDMTSAGQGGKEETAIAAAEDWLKLVDDGKFAESWKEAAKYFKGVVKQDQWEQSIQSVRVPLGVVISRRLDAKNFATSLPGAPDGESSNQVASSKRPELSFKRLLRVSNPAHSAKPRWCRCYRL